MRLLKDNLILWTSDYLGDSDSEEEGHTKESEKEWRTRGVRYVVYVLNEKMKISFFENDGVRYNNEAREKEIKWNCFIWLFW